MAKRYYEEDELVQKVQSGEMDMLDYVTTTARNGMRSMPSSARNVVSMQRWNPLLKTSCSTRMIS